MTIDEAIRLMKIEIECIQRASDINNPCTRECQKCNLLQTNLDLYAAYALSISALRTQQEREKMRCYACVNECNSEDCPLDYHKQTDYCSYYEPYKED